MKEEFLHYVWKYQLFSKKILLTSDKRTIKVVNTGIQNTNAGPDFLHAKIKIGEILWVGNVEIHVKSSDWYVHHHENDMNYDSVILHVVWEYDVAVFDKNNKPIPTIQLLDRIPKKLYKNYRNLYAKSNSFIPCEKQISDVNPFIFNHWKERLFFERLEEKSILIKQLLNNSQNDYEAVLFTLLAKNFGLKVNADAFLNLVNSVDYSIIRKVQNDALKITSLLLGQAGFLEKNFEDAYCNKLKEEYSYLKYKFKLKPIFNGQFQFFRIRPINFPTVRIAQLAALYHQQINLFSKLMKAQKLEDFYELFTIQLNPFWETHYTLKKSSKKQMKRISKPFVDLLIINTIIPLKFNYLKSRGEVVDEDFLKLIYTLKPESNSIIAKFSDLKIVAKNALDSQALLQLKNNYCTKKQCLKCAIGNHLLRN